MLAEDHSQVGRAGGVQSEDDASSHEGAAPTPRLEYQVSTDAEHGVSRRSEENEKEQDNRR